jgi:glycerate 2-kinase
VGERLTVISRPADWEKKVKMMDKRMSSVKNVDVLTGHGNDQLRSKAIEIINHALLTSNPYFAAKHILNLNHGVLSIKDFSIDLDQFKRIFILGAGKATGLIAKALEELLGDRITNGLVVLRHGDDTQLDHTRILFGAHPVPDVHGYEAAKEMMEMAQSFDQQDLVFSCISGGSSALLPLPVKGITLEEKRLVNQLLLGCGADITEINAVRKHLSRIKGGWLARAIFPATLINLTVSDVVGNPLDYITDPTVEDTSTFADACKAVTNYGLWDKFPASVCTYLKNGGEKQETPKDFSGQPLHTFILTDGEAACLGAAEKAAQLGFTPMILSTMVKGEAKDCGTLFASIAKEIAIYNRPVNPPCAIIAGGENTVTIQSCKGTGGPNQEFALSASLDIQGLNNVVVVGLDTDGIDGSTRIAGGMVDGFTVGIAAGKGIDIPLKLRDHDSFGALQSVGDLVDTGYTGTNVNDIKLILVE